MALNLIFGTLSAEFKFNNNVERWNLQYWFIHGRITAAAGLWHMSVAQTQPVRPVTHTFSYYAQYSAHESSLVPWTEHNILTK